MFRDAASKRLEQGPLTVSELDIIKTLLSLCAPGYAVRKIPICIKIEIGEKSDRPVNPITGVEYGTETGAELKQLMDKYNLIGQFAGEKQWLRGGRSLKIGEKPILEYPSIYSSSVKQIMIRIFSFEQTRYM